MELSRERGLGGPLFHPPAPPTGQPGGGVAVASGPRPAVAAVCIMSMIHRVPYHHCQRSLGVFLLLFAGLVETQPLVFAQRQVLQHWLPGWLVVRDVDGLVLDQQTSQARRERERSGR